MAYGLGEKVYELIGSGKLTTSAGRARGKVKKVKLKKVSGGTMEGKTGKVHKVMHEFKEGKLHSGSKTGKFVTNRRQAIAIALSEAAKQARGGYKK